MGTLLSAAAAIALSMVYAAFIYAFLTVFRKKQNSVTHVFFTLCGAWLGVLLQVICMSFFWGDYELGNQVIPFLASLLGLIMVFSVAGFVFADKFMAKYSDK
jgi:putative flippase GtrA